MKKIITTTIIFLSLTVSSISAQNQILKSLKNMDFPAISKLLSPEVQVKIDKNKKITGPTSGLNAIQNKLEAFRPIKMESKHKGSSETEGNDYLIAEFYNAANDRMRVFVHLENGSDGRRICDIKLRSL